MKSKMLVILGTLVMALGLMAQNATQTPTAPSGDNSKACAAATTTKPTARCRAAAKMASAAKCPRTAKTP